MPSSRSVALQNRRAELVSQVDQILENASLEDRELTAEEQASVDERMAEADRLTNRIAVEERLANQMSGIDPIAHRTPPVRTGIQNRQQPPAEWASTGEFLCAVVHASAPGGYVDPRLIKAGGTGLNEGSNPDGGFLVQQQMADGLMQRAFQTGKLTSRVRQINIGPGFNSLKMNAVLDNNRATGSRYGGLQLYWTEEGGLKQASAPKFRQMVLNLKKLIGLMYATDELLEDSVAESVVNQVVPEEYGFVLDDAIYEGSGAGMPLGILGAPATIQVAAEGGQTAGTIVFNNILKMYVRFWSSGKTNGNGLWTINPNAMVQLMQMSAGGTATVYGLPVFIPPGGVSGSPYGTLMGLPIMEIEQASALGTVGDIALIDPSQYVMIQKNGIKKDSSMHVRFIYDEMTFRFVYRCDGQPTWDAPVTPFKGTETISPFVTLAAR